MNDDNLKINIDQLNCARYTSWALLFKRFLSFPNTSSKSNVLSLPIFDYKSKKDDLRPGSLSGWPKIPLSYRIIMDIAVP